MAAPFSSAFWESKIKTYFRRMDIDGDNHLTRNDFSAMAVRFAKEGSLDAVKSEHLNNLLTEIWDKHIGSLGERGITSEAFVESCRKMVKDPAGMKNIEGSLINFFHAVDTDGDELISKNEFSLFFKIIGLNQDAADESFRIIDENGDNQLSLEEFTTMGNLFFTSEDESCISKAFWGPLIVED